MLFFSHSHLWGREGRQRCREGGRRYGVGERRGVTNNYRSSHLSDTSSWPSNVLYWGGWFFWLPPLPTHPRRFTFLVQFDFLRKKSEHFATVGVERKEEIGRRRGRERLGTLITVPLFPPQLWHVVPCEDGLVLWLSWKFQNVGRPLNGYCHKWEAGLSVVAGGRHQPLPHNFPTSQTALLLPHSIFWFRNKIGYHLPDTFIYITSYVISNHYVTTGCQALSLLLLIWASHLP